MLGHAIHIPRFRDEMMLGLAFVFGVAAYGTAVLAFRRSLPFGNLTRARAA
jgi:hypothetical protein